jgi:redox-sensitive bicupin YhaK (pirin superfamily)
MKKILYKADERGFADHGWLRSWHSFSFADYYDPRKIHFGTLRVLNDDIVKGGMGFGMHPHDNMEIVTIPLKGSLEHKDSEGNHGVINTNDVQIMSAGSGLYHSEFNHSKSEEVNLFQIWVFPKEKDIKPRYDQKTFDPAERENSLITVVSPEKNNNSLWINQDAYFSLGKFDKGRELTYEIKKKGNGAYIMVIEGSITTVSESLERRDAIGIYDTDTIQIKFNDDSEILIIEIPMN